MFEVSLKVALNIENRQVVTTVKWSTGTLRNKLSNQCSWQHSGILLNVLYGLVYIFRYIGSYRVKRCAGLTRNTKITKKNKNHKYSI